MNQHDRVSGNFGDAYVLKIPKMNGSACKICKKFCSRFLCLHRNNVTRWTCNSFLIYMFGKSVNFWKPYLLTCHGLLKRCTRSIWAASYSQVAGFHADETSQFCCCGRKYQGLVCKLRFFVRYIFSALSTTDPRHSPERWIEPHPYRIF